MKLRIFKCISSICAAVLFCVLCAFPAFAANSDGEAVKFIPLAETSGTADSTAGGKNDMNGTDKANDDNTNAVPDGDVSGNAPNGVVGESGDESTDSDKKGDTDKDTDKMTDESGRGDVTGDSDSVTSTVSPDSTEKSSGMGIWAIIIAIIIVIAIIVLILVLIPKKKN